MEQNDFEISLNHCLMVSELFILTQQCPSVDRQARMDMFLIEERFQENLNSSKPKQISKSTLFEFIVVISSIYIFIKWIVITTSCTLDQDALCILSSASPSNLNDLTTHTCSCTNHDEIDILSSTDALPKYSSRTCHLSLPVDVWKWYFQQQHRPHHSPKTILVFVHVYKTDGSTIWSFFSGYALLCKQSWMLLIHCMGAISPSIRTVEKKWENFVVKGFMGRKQVSSDNGPSSFICKEFYIEGQIGFVGGTLLDWNCRQCLPQ